MTRFLRLGRSRDHLINLLGEFVQKIIYFKVLDLGIDSTPAGKLVLQIFSALSGYDRESILENTRAGKLLVKEKKKHIGRLSGHDADALTKINKDMERGLSIDEIVSIIGFSTSTMKRYQKHTEVSQ